MKTENCIPGDPIWTNGAGILHNDECLPIIGGCQVSSILSSLDSPNKSLMNLDVPHSMDLLIIPNSDLKLAASELNTQEPNNSIICKDKIEQTNHGEIKHSIHYKKDFNSPQSKNYMVLKEKIEQKNNETPKSIDNNKNETTNLEDLLYFVCNLCPFLCTSNEKISDHLKNAHSNKTDRKQLHLKCPACQNIFYHKISLRSHLIHDHGVSNSDINQIIQAVVYYAKIKMKASEEKNLKSRQKAQMRLEKCNTSSQLKVENHSDALGCVDTLENNKNNSTSNTVDGGLNQTNLELNRSIVRKDKNNVPTKKQISSSSIINNLIENKREHMCVIPLCRVKMQDYNKLQYHMTCHSQSGFKCGECNQEFQFWNSLSGHLWRSHKIDMELFCCNECDYKTYSLAKLNNVHKLIHTDIRSFICNICQKAFKNNKQLRNHKVRHKEKSEKNKHICDICSRSFNDKRQLKLHKDTVHNKMKPFLCNFCGYKASARSSLEMHIRQHTGEKPFSCDSCSYTTSDRNSLRRHKRRHTGDKPYKCAYCSYACIQSSTYKAHLKTKHPGLEKDLMYTCHECQFRSVNKDMYLTHMALNHKEKNSENQECSFHR